MDDMRADDIWALEKTYNQRLQYAVKFRRHYADDQTCAPGRASFLTGLYAHNHQVTTTNLQFVLYYRYEVEGRALNSPDGSDPQWRGPWEKQYDPDLPIGTPYGPRHATDDVEFSTGSLAIWLQEEGVRTCHIGKRTNDYGTAVLTTDQNGISHDYRVLDEDGFPLSIRRTPPGWDYWYTVVGDETCQPFINLGNWNGGTQDAYHSWISNKTRASNDNRNPNDGEAERILYFSYDHRIAVNGVSYSDGQLQITVEPDLMGGGHALSVGDEVVINGCTPIAINTSPAPSVGVVGGVEYVSEVVDEFTFKMPRATDPGAIVTRGKAYTQKYYESNHYIIAAQDFLASVPEDESFYIYLALGAPHQGKSDALESDRRYIGTVSPTEYDTHLAAQIAAGLIDTSDSQYTMGRVQWEQRMESLKSIDDRLSGLFDLLDAKGWSDTIVIFTSDQGCEYGERHQWGNNAGKFFLKALAYEGSAHCPMYIYNPRWAQPANVDKLTTHADVVPTLMDIFGLTDHFVHDKRDGISMLRVMSANHPYPNRAVFMDHDPQDGAHVNALIDENNFKWIDASIIDVESLYDMDSDPIEANNLLLAPHGTESNRADPSKTNIEYASSMRARSSAILATHGIGVKTV